MEDVCAITIYIKDMRQYNSLNQSYIKIINFTNPPARVCVECPLPEGIGVILEASAFKCAGQDAAEVPLEKCTMHIQGISHWAPANIGPYSQAVRVSGFWNYRSILHNWYLNFLLITDRRNNQYSWTNTTHSRHDEAYRRRWIFAMPPCIKTCTKNIKRCRF